MVQFTHLANGNIQITSTTSDALLVELFKQFSQGMVFVPRSFVARTVNNNTQRLVVTNKLNAAKLTNAGYQVYEISPISDKIVARDPDSFFTGLQSSYDKGYTFQAGSATLTFGSYSAVTSARDANPEQTLVTDDIALFDINIALSFDNKESVISYCEQFGIEVDKRKTLPKIKNWLQAKSLQGE